MKMKRSRIFSFCFLIFIAIFINGCSIFGSSETLENTPIITKIEETDDTVSASGALVPQKVAYLSFQNGANDIRILVEVGDEVTAGAILVTSDDIHQATALVSAESQLADAEMNMDTIKRNYERQIRQDAGEAKVDAAEAALEEARANLEAATLRAPFAGTIIEIYANSYENVMAGEIILLLADMNSLMIETSDLNEIDVQKVSVGDPVSIFLDAYPDLGVTGTVVDISMKDDPDSGVNFTTLIDPLGTIPNLRWGMSAFVVIDVGED